MIDFNFTKRPLKIPFQPYQIMIDIKTPQQHGIIRDVFKRAQRDSETSEFKELMGRIVEVVEAPTGAGIINTREGGG